MDHRSTMDLAAAPKTEHEDDQRLVFDLTDDAIVADMETGCINQSPSLKSGARRTARLEFSHSRGRQRHGEDR